MREASWVAVMVVGFLGLALLFLSLVANAIQQAAMGSMVTGFVACTFAIAYAATAIKRRTTKIKAELAEYEKRN